MTRFQVDHVLYSSSHVYRAGDLAQYNLVVNPRRRIKGMLNVKVRSHPVSTSCIVTAEALHRIL